MRPRSAVARPQHPARWNRSPGLGQPRVSPGRLGGWLDRNTPWSDRPSLATPSRSGSMVVPQQTPQSLSASHRARRAPDLRTRFDQAIVQPLMVSFPQIMPHEFPDGAPQHRFPEEDQAVGTLLAETPPEPLQVGIEIGRSSRQPRQLGPSVAQDPAERRAELAVPVQQQVTLPGQEAVVGRGQVAGHLLHPGLIRMGGDAGTVDPAGGQLHHEQQVEGNQAAAGPDLDRREVGGGQNFPVGLQKRRPRRLPFPLGSRLDAVSLEDVGDAAVGQFVVEVGQRPLEAVVAPRRVLLSQADDQLLDLLGDGGSSGLRGLSIGVVPLAGNEESVPAEQGVGGEERAHAGQQLSPQRFGFHCQAAALVIGQAEAGSQLLAEDGVLGAEVVDDQLLLAVGVAGDDAGQRVPRLQDEVHDVRPRAAGNSSIGPGAERVNRSNNGRIRQAQVQRRRTVAGRLHFFTIRDVFVLFFLHVGSRKVFFAGLAAHPHRAWVVQQARNFVMHAGEQSDKPEYLLRDYDTKFVAAFDGLLESEGISVKKVGPLAPNMNAHCERWIQSVIMRMFGSFYRVRRRPPAVLGLRIHDLS